MMVSASSKRTYPRKADIVRAVDAARASGLVVQGLECKPDGTIRLYPSSWLNAESSSEFDAWDKAKRL